MPVKSVLLFRKAERQLQKLPIDLQQRIISATKKLKRNPLVGTSLHGELSGYYKLRVGDYRVIYRITGRKEKTIEIVKIEHRRGVYR